MFAKIINNIVIEWPITNLRSVFPNTSFPEPLKDIDIPDGYVRVESSNPPRIGINEKVVTSLPVLRNGKWVQGWSVIRMTSEEFDQVKNVKAQDIRDRRNRLLAESDWTQLNDAPVNKVSWAQYRQALRDITSQTDFPLTIQWPTIPAENE